MDRGHVRASGQGAEGVLITDGQAQPPSAQLEPTRHTEAFASTPPTCQRGPTTAVSVPK